MIILERWNSRLGNNIVQVYNIITLCIFLNCKFTHTCAKHPYLDLDVIVDYFSKNPDIGKTIQSRFFKKEMIEDHLGNDMYKKYIQKREKFDATTTLLKKCFKLKNIKQIYDETVLVIHIRSGDIFNEKPHVGYAQPPLCYYTHIINSGSYKRIILVCQDTKNPVVDKLLTLYPNRCEHKIQSLTEDIKIILGATIIVCGHGTFIPSLTRFSTHPQTIIYTTKYKRELSKYYEKNLPWKNTEEQRQLMLDYTFKS